ncbi:gp500 [Bacillus phage G]|uniref:Gp500 n=1 Tax=Bacillus phage G TaxID=2884420 RepID=G3MAP1_9CAUD|nr:gp500 [Bacillus phage G]AEO93758.1 gp500 [Bacillus phage G]
MSRLKKLAVSSEELLRERDINVEAADIALNEIGEGIDELHAAYLKLFHGLSSLYEEFPKLYDEMKKVIKFPDESAARDVADMKVDFEDIRAHYKDEQYLANILNLYDGER